MNITIRVSVIKKKEHRFQFAGREFGPYETTEEARKAYRQVALDALFRAWVESSGLNWNTSLGLIVVSDRTASFVQAKRVEINAIMDVDFNEVITHK